MLKRASIIVFFLIFLFFLPASVSSRSLSCEYLMELGKEELRNGCYEEAIHYFTLARLACPCAEKPLFYINLIKRLKEGRLREVTPPPEAPPPEERVIPQKVSPSKKKLVPPEKKSSLLARRRRIIARTLDKFERKRRRVKRKKKEAFQFPFISKLFPPKKVERVAEIVKKERVIYLDEQMWSLQPKTVMEIPKDSSVVIVGRNIEKYFIVSEGFVATERIGKDKIRITGKRIGATFFHLWDNRGRWTFYLKVVFPIKFLPPVEEELVEEEAPFFRFGYSADGSSYYSGKRLGSVKRDSLSFTQRTEIYGEIPYGKIDASANFTKFKETTEVTSYTVGLTKGRIGNFKDFNIRGFDIYKRFSSLSLPGGGVRGFTLEARAFRDKLAYEFFWGRERVAYGYLTPGVLEKREAFVEGLKFTLFPEERNNYSINFAKGYGRARPSYLKERVFSLQTQNFLGDIKLTSEIASDEYNLAVLFNSELRRKDFSLKIGFRDIEKDFTTITGRPAGQGEIGGKINLRWRMSKFNINSLLDVYRDRYLYNPAEPGKFNFDWNFSFSFPLDSYSRWQTNINYVNNPGLISPRRYFKINNNYTRRFKVFNDRNLYISLGNEFRRSRYPLSPTSDFDLCGIRGGFNLNLTKNLNYYLRYRYSWVEDILSGGKSSPRVMTTGISYRKSITSFLSVNLSFSYRDEEDTQGIHSFLAGEDSLDASIGLNYRPSSDFECFLDARVRNIWAENSQRSASNALDIRWGVRSWWDLPFRWSPQGEIRGVVFKDLNGNKKREEGEEGIGGIRIKVGKAQVVTDKKGNYSVKVKAKEVTVAVDLESIPQGFIFTTPISQRVKVIQHKAQIVNFGLSTHSGIWGVIFYDKNGNGKPDPGDVFISKARVILDGKEIVFTDFEGEYFFRDISPGKHKIRIDVNSLPLEYIPAVKVIEELEVGEGTTYVYNISLKKREE